MDRFQQMAVFVAIAEEEGFAAGARRLGMSPPAVTRAVAALELDLGVKLLNRSTRFVRTTDAGQRYLEDARRILSEVQEADEAAAGINAAPRGHLAVTAPVLFGAMFVMPHIVDFMQRFPAVEVSTLFLDRVVNLLEEGQDVGIRIGALPDSSMRAIRVGEVRRVLCASPRYLAEHGNPRQPEDLTSHQIVAASSISPSAIEWKFGKEPASKSVKIKARLTVNSNDAAIAAVCRHAGITRLLSYQVASQLASGELQALLTGYESQPLPVHIVHREGRHGSAKIRAFVDFMADALKNNGALNLTA